jgi:hypothetical protein
MSNLTKPECIADIANLTLSSRTVGKKWGIGKSTVGDYRRNGIPVVELAPEAAPGEGTGYEFSNTNGVIRLKTPKTAAPQDESDALAIFRDHGLNPDDYVISYTFKEWDAQRKGGEVIVLHSAGAHGQPKTAGMNGAPLWPVVQPAAPVVVTALPVTDSPILTNPRFKVALKCADTQIGFRILPDGTLDPFHDDDAMNLFVAVCGMYQPGKITILGDFLDLASQGRFAQEAAFANTTQLALNRGHQFLAELRAACPLAEIILVEGNHDKRMQNFVEANALAAFGLKQANLPDAWPVMSLPFLLRLDALNVKYIDAYPAATDWDNDLTRNIHGTRANSKGSTMGQYVHELPHINTWAGHTHRAEIVYRTVLGARGEAVESYAANPGCLARIDGSVPSVHGSIDASGRPAKIVEDWQAGFGVLFYNDTESWPQVYRIRNGSTIIDGRLITV